MENKIIDGMKKERRPAIICMLLGYSLAILNPISNFYKFDGEDIILVTIVWLMLGTFGLYGWICY